MSKDTPSIMVVGSVHIGNPGRDVNNPQFDDMKSETRQEQILDLVQRFEQFQPTHVALEYPSKVQAKLTDEYHAYLAGILEPNNTEAHQIGFRIAKNLGHKDVYAVDWKEDIGNRGLGDVIDWARQHPPQWVDEESLSKAPVDVTKETILNMFSYVNEPDAALYSHQWYLQRVARVGMGEDYVGIDWLRWWYQRNLTVYANVTRLAQSSSDRILVMFGAGHLHLLSQFFRESALFDVVDASIYLRK